MPLHTANTAGSMMNCLLTSIVNRFGQQCLLNVNFSLQYTLKCKRFHSQVSQSGCFLVNITASLLACSGLNVVSQLILV